MTSRQKLIWFALGAFSSCALSVIAMLMLQTDGQIDHRKTNYLLLEEPVSKAATEDGFDPALIAYQTGEILRDCGAQYFETTFLYDDHLPTADLPIIPQNLDALPCVLLRADKEGISIRTETRWAGNADETEALLKGRNTTASQ